MCGINGIFSYNSVDHKQALRQMNNSIEHRGPDAMGEFVEDYIALGHSRLSIIDLSTASNQPFLDSSGKYVLVFNGEIYNYRAIKSQLTDYDFKTNSDTEVVLAAYIKWGKACLQHFNGMFAFAVYDKTKKEIFIARDRLGIKPLYYYHDEENFIFSSELRAMLNSELVPRKLNKNALSDYFRYQTVHSPKTLINNVFMLKPGHYLQINSEELNKEKYWDLFTGAENSNSLNSLNDYKEKIKQTFFEAVEKRTVADVPMGAFLSGGIDSAAIVGALSEVSSSQVNTFTVVFDEREFSEAEAASKMANRFKTNHYEIHLKSSDFLNEIPAALSAMDHPSGDGINTYTVSKATKKEGITVALSGLGGDELFSGYPVFRQLNSLNEKKWLTSYPKLFRKLAGSTYDRVKKTVASQKIKEVISLDYLEIEHTYPLSRQLYLDGDLTKLLKVPVVENRVKKLAADTMTFGNPGEKLPLQSKISVLEMSTYMQNVLLRDADQMSMAHALEIRVPFLDHKMVELMVNVPDKFKLTANAKELLVDSLDGLLPKELVYQPKKGFVFPWKLWLKTDLKALTSEKLNALKSRSFINEKELDKIWSQFLNEDPRINWSKIWTLVVLENWLQENKINE